MERTRFEPLQRQFRELGKDGPRLRFRHDGDDLAGLYCTEAKHVRKRFHPFAFDRFLKHQCRLFNLCCMELSEHRSDYSNSGFCCRRPLSEPRRFLDCSRRSRAAALGLLALRGVGATAARRMSSTRRSSASARLRSWVRWRCAVITTTPSLVRRLPANRSTRSRTSWERLGERRASKRSCTALASLLTFCPPGPDARMKRSCSSPSAMLMFGVIWITAHWSHCEDALARARL